MKHQSAPTERRSPRGAVSLNGAWRCMPDPEGRGQRLGYHRVEFEFMDRVGSGYGENMWREVEIPCCYSHCGPDMRRYVGAAWFRRSFAVPSAWRNRHVFIRFEALNFLSRIWINDRRVATSYDGLARLDLRVDPYLTFGKENTIIICTDNTERPDDRAPGKGLGYYLSGGIVGDATLIATYPAYVEGARFASAEPTGQGGDFVLKVTIVHTGLAGEQLATRVRIKDRAGKRYGTYAAPPRCVSGGQSAILTLKGSVRGVKPWAPRSPRLYEAEVELVKRGRAVDRITERFGFRRLEIKNKRIHLNGREFFIKGITLHNDYGFYPTNSKAYEVAEVKQNTLTDTRLYYPADSRFEPELCPHREALRRDLKLIKGLGCNYVRLGHFPRIAPELDLFDEMGLLCSVENNLHWWKNDIVWTSWDRHHTERHAARIRRHTTRQLKRMILRDMNHPSVACWVISNECRPGKPGVVPTLQAAVKLARKLDPSRFATHVSAEWHSELGQDDFSHDDVISINSYHKDINFWARELTRLRRRYPDKPIIVTEFSHFIHVRQPSMMTIIQEMCGFLAGFCLYVFTGVGPSQRYRVALQPKGRIQRTSYGLFDRRRKPVLLIPPEAKPVRFELDDRHALLPSAVLQKCNMRDEIFRKELKAFTVREISDVVHSPLVTHSNGEKISEAAHFGLDRRHLENARGKRE